MRCTALLPVVALTVGLAPVAVARDDAPADLDFDHPLLGVELRDGRVPGVDVLDSPDGRRYAYGVSFTQRADGSTELRRDLVTLPLHRLGPRTTAPDDTSRTTPLVPAHERIAPDLRELLLAAQPDEPVAVVIEAVAPPIETVTRTLARRIGRGEIRTHAQHERAHVEIVEARRKAFERAVDPLADAVLAFDGEVLGRCWSRPCVEAIVSPAAASALARRDDVWRVEALEDGRVHVDPDRPTETSPPALPLTGSAPVDITGEHVVDGAQFQPFLDRGYDGENGPRPDREVAIIEPDSFFDDHVAFRDDATTASRIVSPRYNCVSALCLEVTEFTTPPQHAVNVHHSTATTALVVGDLRDGQDVRHTSAADRIARSGYAPEAHAHLFRATTVRGIEHAFAKVATLPRVSTVNASIGVPTNDPTCSGATAFTRSANGLFESGRLLFSSAGNDGHPGHPGAADCRVSAPGAAIGAFTVGGYGVDHSDLAQHVHDGPIWDGSSRGGTATEGAGRTIIDVASLACRTRLNDSWGTYRLRDCGTSYAAPTTMAGAVDFLDHYRADISPDTVEPGALFANLLLMGDRQAHGGRATTRFDNLWGAGRLKLRMWNAAGLDAPAHWESRQVCVRHGDTVTLPVHGGIVLDPAVDHLKAVIYWYDRRHGNDGTLDNVDLRLVRTDGAAAVTSDSPRDNKERVYATGVGGHAWNLEIRGTDVTADAEDCGDDAMKVYAAYYYEDTARDDLEGPPATIDTH